MSLYAVKNDEGEWLGVDRNGSDHWQAIHGDIYSGWFSANERASVFGGHVVELVEAPAKVVVSEEEAEMLEQAKCDDDPAESIVGFVNSHDQYDGDGKTEDRLMRAYVNGWTVEKPKRYVLPMPYGANDDDPDNSPYAAVNREYLWGPAWYQGPCVSFKKAREHYSVTQSDIDAAPDWVKAITPVEVKD
ncbi:DUF1642 domain-containing protein [Lacticaseibacillus hegangensis]|uniref:DUF1642 domain-containing protein n=1 Tax=Lacticaseibacillus hegangensis TaxID=2486010 RepID=A0ABW4CXR7_9LACO|nr:DUF1642 domain-containing protein [Lacticaseibacillus hegangensis]